MNFNEQNEPHNEAPRQEQIQFEINLIVEEILMKLNILDLLACRSLNWLWNAEADRLIRRKFSLKRIIHLRSMKEVGKFWCDSNGNLLHDSFKIDFEKSSPLGDEMWSCFESTFGPSTKFLQLTFHWKRNFYEEFLFAYFPHLIVLDVIDGIFKEKTIFGSEVKLDLRYGTHELGSLRLLKCNQVFTVSQAQTHLSILSTEIMKISPNLEELKIQIAIQIANTENVILRFLESISKYAPQIHILTVYAPGGLDLEELKEPVVNNDKFGNLRLKRLTLIEHPFNIESYFHEERWQFFKHHSLILNSLEEFNLISDIYSNHDLNGYANNLIEHSFLKVPPLALNLQNPWNNLRKLAFSDFQLVWRRIEDFSPFYIFVRDFLPSLSELSVSLKHYASDNKIGHIIAYPFFIWMSQKLKRLERFFITVNKTMNWSKGMEETNLGIPVEKLNDENGDFTMKNIKMFNYSLMFTKMEFLEFFDDQEMIELLNFFKDEIPIQTNELLSKLVDAHGEKVEHEDENVHEAWVAMIPIDLVFKEMYRELFAKQNTVI